MSGLKIEGLEALTKRIERLNQIDKDRIERDQATMMFNSGASMTPVSTEATRPGGPHGELRLSRQADGNTYGYVKEYAPHVEYGHRTRGGGFVPGQYYLKAIRDKQEPIFQRAVREAIRRSR